MMMVVRRSAVIGVGDRVCGLRVDRVRQAIQLRFILYFQEERIGFSKYVFAELLAQHGKFFVDSPQLLLFF